MAEFDEAAGFGGWQSRNGAVLRTCDMRVSGPIHGAQASRGGFVRDVDKLPVLQRQRGIVFLRAKCDFFEGRDRGLFAHNKLFACPHVFSFAKRDNFGRM